MIMIMRIQMNRTRKYLAALSPALITCICLSSMIFLLTENSWGKEYDWSKEILEDPSTATITRVAHWLHHGKGGYKLILERLKK